MSSSLSYPPATLPQIRPATADEWPELHRIFRAAILEGTTGAYNTTQQQVWANRAHACASWWATRLEGRRCLVAEAAGSLWGFGAWYQTLETDSLPEPEPWGCIDLLYVHPRATRRGIARVLLVGMESELKTRGCRRVWTDASLMARPFFEGQGYALRRSQEVVLEGVSLQNFRMEKVFPPSPSHASP